MNLSPDDKVRLLRELTRGADDVYASRRDGTWGPAYAPLTDDIVKMHLHGTTEIGSYPLIPVGNGDFPNVWWIAADFDGKTCKTCRHSSPPKTKFCVNCSLPLPDWETDVQRAVQFLLESDCCLFVNLSRSACGAHVRVLFNEPVPAWLARRWMTTWLEEANVMVDPDEWDEPVPLSFDRLIPPQDWLSGRLNERGNRMPGNLIGSPLHRGLAKKHGGTLPLDPREVAVGNFEPDGQHWEHVVRALDAREWGLKELEQALEDAPGTPLSKSPVAPAPHREYGSLPVINGSDRSLDYMIKFCEFAKHVRQPGAFTYALWVALATQLHRFGEAGRQTFHELSQIDPRYDAANTDKKWEQTLGMRPIRCDTLVGWGYRCPHLHMPRCNGAKSPTYFTDNLHAEIL